MKAVDYARQVQFWVQAVRFFSIPPSQEWLRIFASLVSNKHLGSFSAVPSPPQYEALSTVRLSHLHLGTFVS